MGDLCAGCDIPSWQVISRFHGDVDDNQQAAIKFFREHGVLPQKVLCERCKIPCRWRERCHMWYCCQYRQFHRQKKKRMCNFTVSDYKGTFLEGAHLPPWKILLFINHWLGGNWNHDTILENLKISAGTSIQYRIWCSRVTEFWWRKQKPVGGEGVMVEIGMHLFVKSTEEKKADEEKKGNKKKKKKKGDEAETHLWLYGGMEWESKKVVIVPFDAPLNGEIDRDTIIDLTCQYIKPGSVVVSDGIHTNLTLTNRGYRHLVNRRPTANTQQNPHTKGSTANTPPKTHSKNTDDHTASAQDLEALWQDMNKCVSRPGIRAKYFRQYLSQYLFLRQFPKQRLHQFLQQAAQMCPHVSKCPEPTSV